MLSILQMANSKLFSLCDSLPDVLLCAIMNDWLGDGKELKNIDIAISNKALRSRYLAISPKSMLDAKIDGSKLLKFLQYSVSRKVDVASLQLNIDKVEILLPYINRHSYSCLAKVKLLKIASSKKNISKLNVPLNELLNIFSNLKSLELAPWENSLSKLQKESKYLAMNHFSVRCQESVWTKQQDMHLFYDWLATSCPNLTSFEAFSSSLLLVSLTTDHLFALASSFPTLTKLSITYLRPQPSHYTDLQSSSFAQSIFALRCLELSTVNLIHQKDFELVMQFLRCCPAMESLTLHSCTNLFPKAPQRMQQPLQQAALTENEATDPVKERMIIFYRTFQQLSKSLITFRLQHLTDITDNVLITLCDAFLSTSSMSCPCPLQCLELQKLSNITDKSLRAIVASNLPYQLQAITFYSLPNITDEGIHDLFMSQEAQNTETLSMPAVWSVLKRLHVEGCSHLTERALQSILSSMPLLQTLTFIAGGSMETHFDSMMAVQYCLDYAKSFSFPASCPLEELVIHGSMIDTSLQLQNKYQIAEGSSSKSCVDACQCTTRVVGETLPRLHSLSLAYVICSQSMLQEVFCAASMLCSCTLKDTYLIPGICDSLQQRKKLSCEEVGIGNVINLCSSIFDKQF